MILHTPLATQQRVSERAKALKTRGLSGLSIIAPYLQRHFIHLLPLLLPPFHMLPLPILELSPSSQGTTEGTGQGAYRHTLKSRQRLDGQKIRAGAGAQVVGGKPIRKLRLLCRQGMMRPKLRQ